VVVRAQCVVGAVLKESSSTVSIDIIAMQWEVNSNLLLAFQAESICRVLDPGRHSFEFLSSFSSFVLCGCLLGGDEFTRILFSSLRLFNMHHGLCAYPC
jgi:hypothetical protein